jgi:hypothetical protein
VSYDSERPEPTYSQKLGRQIQDAAHARDRSKERMVLEELRTQLSSARVAVARAGDISESILEARERLAAQEHALISIQSRVQSQDAALGVMRLSLHTKEDQLHELQHAIRQREASVNKQQERLEAQSSAFSLLFKKERSHVQDRIRYLKRELDAERLRRQGLEHKGHQLLEDLVKEQRKRDKDKIVDNRPTHCTQSDCNCNRSVLSPLPVLPTHLSCQFALPTLLPRDPLVVHMVAEPGAPGRHPRVTSGFLPPELVSIPISGGVVRCISFSKPIETNLPSVTLEDILAGVFVVSAVTGQDLQEAQRSATPS